MINRTVLVGRLTRDPELRYTQGGTAVMGFTVAVNRQFTNSQGEREADFINCVIWRKAAENFAKFTNKGSLVGIDGRLQTRNYENQQGNRVYVTEVVVENFSLLESRKDTEERQEQNNKNDNTNSDYVSKNNLPMDQRNSGNNNSMGQRSGETNDSMGQRGQGSTEQGNQMGDPFTDNSKPIDISDDDLPF